MGLRVTAAQAAWLVDHGERMVRWHIQTRKDLPAVKDGRSWAIDVDALEAIPGWRVNRDRLAELEATEGRTAASMVARIAELERQMRELRARLARLEAATPQATASEGQQAAWDDGGAIMRRLDAAMPPGGHYSAASGLSPDVRGIDGAYTEYARKGPLPAGLVSLATFAKAHGIQSTAAVTAADRGRLPVIQGDWTISGGRAQKALDANGRRAFFERYHDHANFQRCAECPH